MTATLDEMTAPTTPMTAPPAQSTANLAEAASHREKTWNNRGEMTRPVAPMTAHAAEGSANTGEITVRDVETNERFAAMMATPVEMTPPSEAMTRNRAEGTCTSEARPGHTRRMTAPRAEMTLHAAEFIATHKDRAAPHSNKTPAIRRIRRISEPPDGTETRHGGTMQTAQGNMLDSLRNVKAFLDDHPTELAGVVKTGTRNSLLEAIANLAAHQENQAGNHVAAKSSTQVQRALRQALLKDHMSVIARIARASLPNTPTLQPLRMPRGKPSLAMLASDAYGMANVAEAHAEVFVAAGLPDDFVAKLKGAADDMIAAGNDRSASRGRRGGATKGLKAQLTAGRKIVAVLDAMVKTALRRNPALLANWNVVKRVARVTGRTATTTPAPVPAPTPAPTPAPRVASTPAS